MASFVEERVIIFLTLFLSLFPLNDPLSWARVIVPYFSLAPVFTQRLLHAWGLPSMAGDRF